MSTTVTSYPTSYTTSGSISGTRYRNAIGNGANTSAVSGNDYASGGSSSKAYIYYSFEFDIPEVATIESCTCQVKGHLENTSRSTAQLDIMCGSTSKANSKFTSTSAQTITLNASSMTAAEANEVQLRFTIGYYGGLINGATMTIVYSINLTKYTITSSATDVEINPSGDTEVYEGEDYELSINEENDVVVTDNGVDVTSQLIQKTKTDANYTITNVTSSYGFELNNSDYYESNNQGHSNSAAVCRVDIHVPVSATITFSIINYAESTYDFGLLSNIDETLDTDSSADTTNVYWSGKEHNSSSVQTITYSNVTAGEHFIYVKYFKDQYTDDNNDSLQFKIDITLNETFIPGTYWSYTLSNITTNHTIVVSLPASDVLYIKLNGSWVEISETSVVYKKINDSWVEQTDLTSVFDSNVNYKFGS